jgi:hypothetical protein
VDESVDSVEALEERISALRAAVRRAVLDGDADRARALRRDLRHAEQDWDNALDAQAARAGPQEPRPEPGDDQPSPEWQPRGGPGGYSVRLPGEVLPRGATLLPLREQVHEALSLLQVPAAPRLIATVHEAFYATSFPTARLTSLRRDEERSFKTAPFARPYYICAALAADFLSPSRGLLAISTWPTERRIIASLSPRVDFLIAAINVAQAIEHIPEPVPAARALLARFAANVRGSSSANSAGRPPGRIDPQSVIRAAQAELAVHQDEDRAARAQAARRARGQLDEVEQLFGAASFRRPPRTGDAADDSAADDGPAGRGAAGAEAGGHGQAIAGER